MGWWQEGAELGWTSLLVPEEDGGGSVSGHGLLDLVLVAEEMGRRVAPGPLDRHQSGGLGGGPVGHVRAEVGLTPRDHVRRVHRHLVPS